MNLEELREYLDHLAGSLKKDDQAILGARLEGLISVFPFSEYEKLRKNYVSANRYLDLYGLAPRIFGQIWCEKHVMDLDARFRKPDRSLDPEYDGQYDLWFDGMRVEVKAARAINTKKRGSLVSKALRLASHEPFWMNFQQLKLDVCDAFVFVGVWVDTIVYWVMSNQDVKTNKFLSHQHRGGIEYQIGITDKNVHEFDRCKTEPGSVANAVLTFRE